MDKKAQIDALRGERIWDTMFDEEREIWVERFFERVAPWADRTEHGDCGLTGGALSSFDGGRVAVLAMAKGRSGSDGWKAMLFSMRPARSIDGIPLAQSREIQARKPMPKQKFASSIRALPRAAITQMLQSDVPAFSAQFCRPPEGFYRFLTEWSFRAGVLATVAIAEGKDTCVVIDQLIEDAFIASGGQFLDPRDEI
jgi:hypothetical protein